MKLYYCPGTCSLSPHIALVESGLPHELVKTDIRSKKLADGGDFLAVNPKGQVPVLVLDSGETFTEGPVVVQIIADLAAEKSGEHRLAPANGTTGRYRVQEWLNYTGTELHKSFGPLFVPTLADETKAFYRSRLAERFRYVNGRLAGRDYLNGDFSVADCYMFVMLTWAAGMKIDLAGCDNLVAYEARMRTRPAVQKALASE